MNHKKAVVLLSGGLDSTTALYAARKEGCQPYCLIIDYGQRHSREIQSAEEIARRGNFPYQVLECRLPWGGSALLDSSIPIPKERTYQQMTTGIPTTYVPARNTLFLSFALSWAEVVKAGRIVIGANHIDWSGYPDCRPEFFKAYEKVIQTGTKMGSEGGEIKIWAPLLEMNKAQIVKLGAQLGVPFEWTWSCYQGERIPCGRCDSCQLRAKGFKEAGIEDPLISVNPSLEQR